MNVTPQIDFDDEGDDDGMTTMVNISDDPIVVRLSVGQRVRKVTIKPGKSAQFDAPYCEDVRGAGKQVVLLPILTRQSMREDRIPRLVRKELAEKARAYFESRMYGTEEGAKSEIEDLEAKLAAAKAKKEYFSKKPSEPAEVPLRKMKHAQLQEIASARDIDPDQTRAALIKALESDEE